MRETYYFAVWEVDEWDRSKNKCIGVCATTEDDYEGRVDDNDCDLIDNLYVYQFERSSGEPCSFVVNGVGHYCTTRIKAETVQAVCGADALMMSVQERVDMLYDARDKSSTWREQTVATADTLSPIVRDILRDWMEVTMSDISQQHYDTSWKYGLEVKLWEAIQRLPEMTEYGKWKISARTLVELRAVSELLGEWYDGKRFIPLEEWKNSLDAASDLR